MRALIKKGRMNDGGSYILLISLKKGSRIEVGKLGSFMFPQGYYTYVGSAMSGIGRRVLRHKSKNKKLHWHIDYLLKKSKILDVIEMPSRERMECKINKKIQILPEAKIVSKGFGSSDCNCESHLTYFRKKPRLI